MLCHETLNPKYIVMNPHTCLSEFTGVYAAFSAPCNSDSVVQQSLQEVERVLFLVSAVARLKGRWQMATQGALGATGLLQAGGPFAVRQASCAFLDFAALAADHQQHPCCLPVSAPEKVCLRVWCICRCLIVLNELRPSDCLTAENLACGKRYSST